MGGLGPSVVPGSAANILGLLRETMYDWKSFVFNQILVYRTGSNYTNLELLEPFSVSVVGPVGASYCSYNSTSHDDV